MWSAFSTRIAAIEHALGARLFDRTTRTVDFDLLVTVPVHGGAPFVERTHGRCQPMPRTFAVAPGAAPLVVTGSFGELSDRDVLRVGQRPLLGLQRCGHDDEDQVLPHGLLHLAKHRDGQIGVQAALVKLVEDDDIEGLPVKERRNSFRIVRSDHRVKVRLQQHLQ